MNPDLKKPEGLEPAGEKAYETIMAFLKRKRMTYTGGCKAFYSPAEWAQRGEDSIGPDAVLVVVHDGGELAPIFNISYEQYALGEEMRLALEPHELWFESHTCWFGVVNVTRSWAICDTYMPKVICDGDKPFVYTDVKVARHVADVLNTRLGEPDRFKCIPHAKSNG